jgi:hypothetical protein
MSFSSDSALEPTVQFKNGFDVMGQRIGEYLAPATAQDAGTFVKMTSDEETLAVSGDNDAQFILQQPCALVGPIGSAANREKWMGGIPQNAVACGAQITVLPITSGGRIWTSIVATGTETGAMSAASIVPGTTEFAVVSGKPRVLQVGDTALGIILSEPDARGGVDLIFY